MNHTWKRHMHLKSSFRISAHKLRIERRRYKGEMLEGIKAKEKYLRLW